MKILQLAPQFPFPENDGGKIGIASTFKQLAVNADVTFFCYCCATPDIEQLNYAKSYGKVIIFDHSTKNTPLRIFKSLFETKPLYLSKHISNEVLEFLRKLVVDEKFDFIHADHTAMAPVAIALKEEFNIPVGLRLHNVEHLIWRRYEESLQDYHPKKWYVKSQADKLQQAEAEILRQVTVSFPITDEDAKLAKKLSPDANIVVAGPGIGLEKWQRQEVLKKNSTLIHATTYDWVHNVDAVRWFINNVIPKLQEFNPEIRLQLLGKNPPPDFSGKRGVDVLGFVSSVMPYLSAAGIYVAPLFVGGGVRIKILEAMAMELPVIASPVSAEGIKGTREDGLIIAESADDFVKEILYLVENPNLVQELGKKARKFVLENYTWEKSIGIIYNTYKNILIS
jgi:polysaccharide biosynthesis protein PslH